MIVENMKTLLHRIILVTIAVSLFASCKKDDPSDNKTEEEDNDPVEEVLTAPPAEFDAKAVVEMFGGEWCANCPAGVTALKSLMDKNPDDVYGTVVHSNDDFETINFNSLFSHLGGLSAYPKAAVNRIPATNSGNEDFFVIYSASNWGTNINRFINKKTNIGLALETEVVNAKANIKVHILGYDLDPLEDYKLTLYILQDNVPSINQLGAPAGYIHDMVLRGSLTNSIGDEIDLNNGITLTKNFVLNIGGDFVEKDMKILAFVNTVGGDSDSRKILNAQQVKVGKTANWD